MYDFTTIFNTKFVDLTTMSSHRKKTNPKKIQLVFPKIKNVQGIAIGDTAKSFVTTVEEIKDWFSLYDIDSIQVWISGAVQTGGILKLIVSASGQGGVAVTLKPKLR